MADQPTGPALDREVERVVFGDDGSCFASHGIERRDRIGRAMWMTRFGEQPSYACHNMTGRSMTFEWGGEEFLFETQDDYRSLPFKSLQEIARGYWDHRHGKPWQAALEAHVAAYRAEPRPFSRDVRLAMGLLNEFIAVSMNFSLSGGVQFVSVMKPGSGEWSICGEAFLSEFPSAKDDAERRELAMCHAICRAVLASKG